MRKIFKCKDNLMYNVPLIFALFIAAFIFQGCVSKGGGFSASGPAPVATVTPDTTIAGYLSDDAVSSPVLYAGLASSRAVTVVAENWQYTVLTDSAGFFKADIQLSSAIAPVIIKFQKKDSTLVSGEYMVEKGGVYYLNALIDAGAGLKINADKFYSFVKVDHPDNLKVAFKKVLDERQKTATAVSRLQGRVVLTASHIGDKASAASVVTTDETASLPLAGVSVSLSPGSRTAVTDANGYFSMACDLTAGNYSLTFRKTGYPARAVNFIVESKDYTVGVLNFFAGMESGLKSLSLSRSNVSIVENSFYNLNGVKAFAVYSDNTTREVGAQWTASEGNITNLIYTPPAGKKGTFVLTAKYIEGDKSQTALLTISVNASLSGLALSETSSIAEANAAFDLKTVKTTASYTDGTTRAISASWTADRGVVSGFSYTPPAGYLGEINLTASYTEGTVTKTAAFKLTISRIVKSLVLSRQTDEIGVGSVYKVAELTATVSYSDKTSKVVTPFWSYNGAALENQNAYLAPASPQKVMLSASYAEDGTAGSASFEIIVRPQITELSSYAGVPGETIAITGKGFGAPRGDGLVKFNQKYASDLDIQSWTDTVITVKIPSGSTPGDLSVIINQIQSNAVKFDTSYINSISPASGTAGTLISITGSGFGVSQGSNQLKFGAAAVSDIISWSNAKIVARVPAGMVDGEVYAELNGFRTNSLKFGLMSITSVTPSAVKVGDIITIIGTGFGLTQESSAVKIGALTAADIASWSDSKITVKVPAGALSGPIIIVSNGASSNSFNLSVTNISSITPARGLIGATVTISGTNFGLAPGTVKFNGITAAEIVSWTDSKILVKVPAGSSTGAVSVTVGGTVHNGFYFEVISISNIEPAVGKIGDAVTIIGSGFGAIPAAAGQVKIGAVAVSDILLWNDRQIKFKVPDKSISSKITVAVNGLTSNGVDFRVIKITSLSQNYGPAGMPVTINGSGFGSSPAADGRLMFNGAAITAADIIEWSDAKIIAKIPLNSVPGSGTIEFLSSAAGSNKVLFDVTYIYSIDRSIGTAGSQITINGTGFGPARGNNAVTFNSVSASSITSWAIDKIIVSVPAAAASGPLEVVISAVKTNSKPLSIISIYSLSAARGAADTQITVYGSGFGSVQGSNKILINDIEAHVVDGLWTDRQVRIAVPDDAVSGSLKAVINDFETNGMNFDIVSFDQVMPITPAYGPAGSMVTINGSGFGAVKGEVKFNIISAASISEWKNNRIVASVPSGAVSGLVTIKTGDITLSDPAVSFKLSKIDSVAWAYGPSTPVIRITGSGFGPNSTDKYVKVSGSDAALVSWSETAIEALLPSGIASGAVSVNIWGKDTNSYNFTGAE